MSITMRGAASRRLMASALILGTLGIATAANADSQIDVRGQGGAMTRSAVVRIADLNLADPVARRALDHRVSFAVKSVCSYSPTFGLRQPKDYLRCADEAQTDAHRQISLLQQTAGNGTVTLSGR